VLAYGLAGFHHFYMIGNRWHVFPEQLAGPFHQGLSAVLVVATALAALAALASLLRGRHEAGTAAPPAGPGERFASPQQISA
jgi:hypothetical protein